MSMDVHIHCPSGLSLRGIGHYPIPIEMIQQAFKIKTIFLD